MDEAATAKEKCPPKKRAECSNCGGVRNCWVRGAFKTATEYDGIDFFSQYQIMQCMGCDTTFFMITNTNTEDYIRDNYDEVELVENNVYWPARAARPFPDWFNTQRLPVDNTDVLENALLEVYGALNNELHSLAAVGMRTAFDVSCTILGVEEHLSFEKKVDGLIEKRHIGTNDKGRIETIIDAGSAAAHRGWRPKVHELATMMDTLEHFIYHSIVEPHERKKLDEGVGKLKPSVPTRPKKPKNDGANKSRSSTPPKIKKPVQPGILAQDPSDETR